MEEKREILIVSELQDTLAHIRKCAIKLGREICEIEETQEPYDPITHIFNLIKLINEELYFINVQAGRIR